MLHGVCPTQVHIAKIRLTAHAVYPCCQQELEDSHHVLICDEQHQDTYTKFRDETQKALPEVNHKGNLFKKIIESTTYKRNKVEGKWIFEDQDQIIC